MFKTKQTVRVRYTVDDYGGVIGEIISVNDLDPSNLSYKVVFSFRELEKKYGIGNVPAWLRQNSYFAEYELDPVKFNMYQVGDKVVITSKDRKKRHTQTGLVVQALSDDDVVTVRFDDGEETWFMNSEVQSESLYDPYDCT
jgi:hypothetical protein